MGSHLATMLSGNGHDITVIDRDAKALEEVVTIFQLNIFAVAVPSHAHIVRILCDLCAEL